MGRVVHDCPRVSDPAMVRRKSTYLTLWEVAGTRSVTPAAVRRGHLKPWMRSTMDADLKKLIDDPRFLKYHAETVKGKRFNPFDVLRYSDYEIRHSNVLAWLLQPNETHGIGDVFLRDFMAALNDGARSQGIPPVPLPSSFESQDVVVERESYDVDITLSFRNERVVIAIENKVGEASPEHASQVMAYEERLREQRGGTYDVLQSVLLTTSSMVDVSERRFIHVSWARVHDIVQSIQQHEGFDFDEGERVRAFLGHYLEIVERMAVQPGVDSHYFTTLLDDHRPILTKLLEEREQGVDDADEGMPDGFGAYSETLDQLVSDFRREPKRLRSAVRTFLEHKGFWTSVRTSTAYSTYYLYFWTPSMEETRKSLDLPWQPRWLIIFDHREVLLQLQLDPSKEDAARPVVDRIMRFMKENPIDAFSERRNRYPMDAPWTGCLMVYKHPLMTDEVLSTTPVAEIQAVTLRKMAAFLDRDFRRIETYLKCLAFDPAPSA